MTTLTARNVQEIRRHFVSGESRATLAIWYAVNEKTIWRHTKDLVGGATRQRFDRDYVRSLKARGVPVAEIAARYGVTPHSVRKALRQAQRGEGE